jgi:GTPase SAR1 family protein
MYYPNTDIFVICFAIDNRYSFANVRQKWIPEIRNFCPRTPVILVGLKIDLRTEPNLVVAKARVNEASEEPVSTAEGNKLCRSIGACRYVECSAKTTEGVHEVFQIVARIASSPPSTETSRLRNFRCVLLWKCTLLFCLVVAVTACKGLLEERN